MAATSNNINAALTGAALTSPQYMPLGDFDVVVSGVFAGNARLMVSRDQGATWQQVYVFTGPDMVRIEPVKQFAPPIYEVDMSQAGDYTSGTAAVFIGR